MENIQRAVKVALCHGAQGILVSDWCSSRDAYQPLSASLVGLLAGGGLAWNPEARVCIWCCTHGAGWSVGVAEVSRAEKDCGPFGCVCNAVQPL